MLESYMCCIVYCRVCGQFNVEPAGVVHMAFAAYAYYIWRLSQAVVRRRVNRALRIFWHHVSNISSHRTEHTVYRKQKAPARLRLQQTGPRNEVLGTNASAFRDKLTKKTGREAVVLCRESETGNADSLSSLF